MLKTWIKAARLRTLPLAASGIIAGATLAWYNNAISWAISGLALLTALLLQILSNFANDYGDFTKGTDNERRVGPERTMQSGAIAPLQMRRAMVMTGLLSFASGLGLIYLAAANLGSVVWLVFGILGLLAIAAAVMYTVGKRAYGYHGLGDVMVFIFFGLASVVGTYFLNAGKLPLEVWVLAIGIGTLSTGVLNLNNMRDIDNDLASGKRTLAAQLGYAKAKKYHSFLILTGIVCFLGLAFPLNYSFWTYFILIIPSRQLALDLKRINKQEDKSKLDPFLKKLSLGTFFMTVTFVIALVLTKFI